MSALPGGAVTFLFTDIEGSTRLVKALREGYAQVLAEHRRLVRAAVAVHGGHEVDTQGDAFFVAFAGAKQAVLCAVEIQRALAGHQWPAGAPVRVRIGVHTGQAVPAGGGYTGLAVHRAARICAAARGGQVLISQATQALVEDEEEELGFTLVDAGEHRLKGLDRAVRLFQLAAAGLDPGFPPRGGFAAGGMHGFPAGLTSFIGRDGPVREVTGLLERYRLVTVTGPGGSGKTRLAAEVAKRVAARFADGVWLIELAPVTDPAQVAAVVAAAMGIREQRGVPAAEALAEVLTRQQLMLVLDNCEHVIDAAAEICGRLLLACDDVRILATGREPLQVAAEARYRLAPLTLPDTCDSDGGGTEAVALFVDRARQADLHFALTSQNGPAVACLVTRLDGMPLAIELAAARVEALGVDELLAGLDDRFALLAGRDRLAAGRHRSLAAAVEWSYQLLDDTERRVFRRLSVFPGPFTLEGAEAVAGDGTRTAVLRLVDCSLLSPPRPGVDGRSRYLMLETLRAYGAGLLAGPGERDGLAAALAGYALRVAEEAAAGLETAAREAAAARRLDAEDATMRQALAWVMGRDPDMALRLAIALAPWWFLRGRAAGEYPVLREAVGRAEAGGDAWCTAQWWLGSTALSSGDLSAALGHFTAIEDAVANRGASRALAECLGGRSTTLSNLGRATEAAENGRRCLAVALEIGYPYGQSLALDGLAICAYCAGDIETALELQRQAQQIPDLPGWMTRNRSTLLATLLTETGDLALAEDICAEGLAQSRDAGDPWNIACQLIALADLDRRAGRMEDAAAHLREATRIVARSGIWFELENIVDCCGHLCAATGRCAEALTVWAAWAALSSSEVAETTYWVARRREAQREAREALGPDRSRTAEERGAAMSRAVVIEYVLLLTTPAQQTASLSDPGSAVGQLSTRERELITLVAQGRTDAQIAAQLFISVRTVGSHLDRIRDKTGCRRRVELTRLALSSGLI
jgi:predicted ATPase/class 3 adenylate cyclase/DNA-binding CsgD family transcriptional regulator